MSTVHLFPDWQRQLAPAAADAWEEATAQAADFLQVDAGALGPTMVDCYESGALILVRSLPGGVFLHMDIAEEDWLPGGSA